MGGLSEPVRTPAGWAVVRVLEKKDYDPAAFEKEKAALTASLAEERRGQLFRAYMQEARKRFPVLRRPDALRRVDQLMHVEVRRAGDVVIVDLKGKLTAGLGDQILRDTLDELLAESWRKILLNLSEVSFLDSAGPGRAGGRAQDRAQPGRGAQGREGQRARAHHALPRAPAAPVRGLRGRGRKRSAASAS